jgi:hypothetical protein
MQVFAYHVLGLEAFVVSLQLWWRKARDDPLQALFGW